MLQNAEGKCMEIIRELSKIKLHNTVVAVGKFDGIHKGHRMLLEQMQKEKVDGLSVVFTFEKAPIEEINQEDKKHILTKREKYRFFKEMDVDLVVECPINSNIITMEAEEFIKTILVEKLGMKANFCGSDFRFGHNRLGDVEFLKSLEKKYNYKTIVFEKIKIDNIDISSTYIREKIQKGDIEKTLKMLDYPYTIIGEVIHGNKIGRTIGFPTANIAPDDDKLLPPNGVYFTKVTVNNKKYSGITNIGCKPTVENGNEICVETNIIGLCEDIYGQCIVVEFYHYHRNEIKFKSLDDLKRQIKSDYDSCINFKFDI